jgi:hypothetical protein
MISLKELLLTEEVQRISLQQALDKKMFGPVYHGTTEDRREKIDREGFKIFVGHERSGEISQGYEASDYSGGIPAPIHHLGFGVYFTTSKTIAKRFAGGTTRGMKTYFLDVPRMEEINWGSQNTMMKWWLKSGYNYKVTPETTFGTPKTNLAAIRAERLRATQNLTKELSSKYDAVWYKGKGMYRLLDGDQVVVFVPINIYLMDKHLINPGETGSVVVMKADFDPYGRGEKIVPAGTLGIITKRMVPTPEQEWARGSNYIYHVRFNTGGEHYNILDKHIEPFIKK